MLVTAGSGRRSSDMVEYGSSDPITDKQQLTLDLLQSHVHRVSYSETDGGAGLDRNGLQLARELVKLGVFAVDVSMENLFVLHRPGSHNTQACSFICIPASEPLEVYQIKPASLSLRKWRRVIRSLARSGLLHLVRFDDFGSLSGVSKDEVARTAAAETSRPRSAPGQGKSPTRRSVRTQKKNLKTAQQTKHSEWTLSLPQTTLLNVATAAHDAKTSSGLPKLASSVLLTGLALKPTVVSAVAVDGSARRRARGVDKHPDQHKHRRQEQLAQPAVPSCVAMSCTLPTVHVVTECLAIVPWVPPTVLFAFATVASFPRVADDQSDSLETATNGADERKSSSRGRKRGRWSLRAVGEWFRRKVTCSTTGTKND